MSQERALSRDIAGEEEQQYELSLRPRRLDEYIGQHKVKENLGIFIKAALKRAQALDQ